jgi:rod shape-determining protein MreD
MMQRLITVLGSRWTRLVLVALVLLAIQTTLLSDLRPFGVMVQVLVLFVASAGVLYGSEVGAITGFVVGLMYDAVLTTPLGSSALVFGVVGVLAGGLPYFVREPTWWSRIVLVVLLSALGEVLFPMFQAIIGFEGWVQPRMFVVALVVALINLVIAPAMMPLTRWTLKESVTR